MYRAISRQIKIKKTTSTTTNELPPVVSDVLCKSVSNQTHI